MSVQALMIRLRNLSKTVTSGTKRLTILDAVDLHVPRGQFVAGLDSGSGKSTLLSLVAGLDAPTTGTCRRRHIQVRGDVLASTAARDQGP